MSRPTSALLLILAVPVFAAEPKTEEFTSKGGKFSIRFPGKPQEKKQESDTAVGKITIYVFDLIKGEKGYQVSYNDFPDKGGKILNVDTALNSAAVSLAKRFQGKLVKQKKIALEQPKAPGRDVWIDVPTPQGKAVIHSRFFLLGNRLYQINVVGRENFVTSKEATLFLDSFKVNK